MNLIKKNPIMFSVFIIGVLLTPFVPFFGVLICMVSGGALYETSKSKDGSSIKSLDDLIQTVEVVNKNIEAHGADKRKYEIKSNQFDYSNELEEVGVDDYNIDYFYHMTHRKNLSKIFKKGLLPHGNRFVSKRIDNDSVNARRDRSDPVYGVNLHSYVPFYFNPRNPMLYVQKDKQDKIVILGFSNELILEKGVVFTDGNAAVDKTKFFSDVDDLNKLNWDCINGIYWTDYEDGKREMMSELLVPNMVPIRRLKVIFCPNIETKLKVDDVVSSAMAFQFNIKVVVDKSKFF